MSSMSPMILYDRESRKVHRVKFLFCTEGFPFFTLRHIMEGSKIQYSQSLRFNLKPIDNLYNLIF
jgi:hypothetical protein